MKTRLFKLLVIYSVSTVVKLYNGGVKQILTILTRCNHDNYVSETDFIND